MSQDNELIFSISDEESEMLLDIVFESCYDKDTINYKKNLPETIYHYTSPSGLQGIISSNSMWFTHYKFLNDKSEKYYAFSTFKECLVEQKENLNKNFYDAVLNLICEGGNFSENIFYQKASKFPDYYIASFSLNPDSLNMWNYYTKDKNKTGYSLEFKLSELEDSLVNKSYNAYRVNYDKEKLIQKINYYIRCFNEGWDDNRSKVFLHCLCMLLIESIDAESLQNKHHAFSSEEEFRIVFKIEEYNREKIRCEKLMKFRELNGIMVPFLDIGFNKECVKGIRISPTQQDELAKEGLRIVLDNNEYKNIPSEKITVSDIPLRY